MILFLSVRGLIVWHLWIQEVRTDTACSSAIARLFLSAVFGANVRRLRKISKVSKVEFARRCGVGRPYLDKVEHGKANPTLEYLGRFAGRSTWTPSTCSRPNLRWAAAVMLAWRRFAASRTLCPLGVGIPIAVDGDCRGFDCEMAMPPIVFLGNRALFQLPSLLLGLYSCGLTDGALVRFA